MKSYFNKKGFTLIELLVVISIIGLLSSVVLASLNVARSKARDARRLSDIRQVQNALELYRSNNNTYPDSGSFRENSCNTGTASDTGTPVAAWDSALSPLVSAKYIASLPDDPQNKGTLNTSRNYCYAYAVSSASIYSSCLDIQSGAYEALSNYEYALFLSLENTPTQGKVINWKADTSSVSAPISAATLNAKPYNYCILGPRK